MMNPTAVRLSEHFLLSDFMGNHSVYSRGFPNNFPGMDEKGHYLRVANGTALCEEALEPMLKEYGPMSISYGFIDPRLSREIVTYMDPDKPSHHRWDLGAAADVCVHGRVNSDPDDDTAATSPIMLAHDIAAKAMYSRMITYSESPYICVAVSAREVENGTPRLAFYENRYEGKARAKPAYRSYSSENARLNALARLRVEGLPQGWRGAGYPTYHGGGRRQFQHFRTSKYTMMSDWLFDLQSISNGAINMPNLRDSNTLEMFYAVGDAYDSLLDLTGAARMSIIAGYVSPSNPYFDPSNDWRDGIARFSVIPPESMTAEDVRTALLFNRDSRIVGFGDDPHVLEITVQL